jgi:hypothetical protein
MSDECHSGSLRLRNFRPSPVVDPQAPRLRLVPLPIPRSALRFSRLSSLVSRLSSLVSRLSSLVSGLSSLDSRLWTLVSGLSSLDSRLWTLLLCFMITFHRHALSIKNCATRKVAQFASRTSSPSVLILPKVPAGIGLEVSESYWHLWHG